MPPIRIKRIICAPTEQVWQMWVDSQKFARWYGPIGAKIPLAEMDVRIGGKRKIAMTMQTSKGEMQIYFVGDYLEIEPPNRLVYTEAMADEAGNLIPPSAMGMPEGTPQFTKIIVELFAHEKGTKMIMTHQGVEAASAGEMGWKMALDKLETQI